MIRNNDALFTGLDTLTESRKPNKILNNAKMSKSHLRKLACGYIVDRLSNSRVSVAESHQYSNVYLHELILLKEDLEGGIINAQTY